MQEKHIMRLDKIIGRDHKGSIFRMSWSPCGNFVATPCQDHSVRIWDAFSGHCLLAFNEHSDEVNCAKWSPDGKLVASCADDMMVIIWKAETGEIVHKFQCHTDEINEVIWSPDSNTLASVADDKHICVYDLVTLNQIKRKKIHDKSIWSADWSPDGKWIATASDDNTLKIWNYRTDEVRIFRKHTSTVRTVKWFSNSRQIVTGGRDSRIIIWNIDMPDSFTELEGHSKIVTSVSISFDDKFIASKSHDNSVRIWNTANSECVDIFPEQAGDRWSPGLAFKPNSYDLATLGENDTVCRLWKSMDICGTSIVSKPLQKNNDNPNNIFISYSRKDEMWMQRLVTMLQPLISQDNYKLNLWVDTAIAVGDDWSTEIQQALDESNVAILLVSYNFLASSFISEVELPQLLEKYNENKCHVVWIPVSDAIFESQPSLNRIQAICDPKTPLSHMSAAEQDRILMKVCVRLPAPIPR